jgi:predicted nuclease with TOPRIM domain
MEETYQALLGLQELDEQMSAARERVRSFAPELEELEAPVVAAQREVDALRERLVEMRAEVRRLRAQATELVAGVVVPRKRPRGRPRSLGGRRPTRHPLHGTNPSRRDPSLSSGA